jgi:hypothetical protein
MLYLGKYLGYFSFLSFRPLRNEPKIDRTRKNDEHIFHRC